jgi:16S rRNA (guanine(966)-N(2))-methyltransferase RsmD
MGSITITSGILRGRRILTPEGSETRPLLTRLRKSLADILRPRLAQARLLDLFGGSGAIAFELLSNGAAAAVVVELTPKTAELIRLNARSLGIAQAVDILQGDGVAALEGLARKQDAFDIVIVAPPYGLGLQQKAVAALARKPLLKPDGIIIVQREEREPQAAPPDGLALVRSRSYGRTVFDFYAEGASGVQPLQKA